MTTFSAPHEIDSDGFGLSHLSDKKQRRREGGAHQEWSSGPATRRASRSAQNVSVFRQGERVYLVVVRAAAIGESRPPIQDPVNDGGSIHHAAAGIETPKDLSRGGIERIYIATLRWHVHHSVGFAHRSHIHHVGRWVGGLPQDVTVQIEGAPRAPGDGLPVL